MNIKARLHSIKPKFLVCSEDHPRPPASASAVRTTASTVRRPDDRKAP